jgi:hypothetical protein
MLLKQEIANIANGYDTRDSELTDALAEAFRRDTSEYEGCKITTIASDWINGIGGEKMAIVDIQCADGIQRLGYWSNCGETVVDALDNHATLQSWAKNWFDNADTCPLLVQNQVVGG